MKIILKGEDVNVFLLAVAISCSLILGLCWFTTRYGNWEKKYNTLKSFIEDTGIADEEWLNK